MSKRDGRIVKVHALNAMFPYMFRSRTESLVYYNTALDVENLLAYIEKKQAEGIEIKFFQMFMACVVKLFKERPYLNRFISGRKLYQRNDIKLSFIAKKQASDEGEETNVALTFNEKTTFQEVIDKLKRDIKTAKSDDVKKGRRQIDRIGHEAAAVHAAHAVCLSPVDRLLFQHAQDVRGCRPAALQRLYCQSGQYRHRGAVPPPVRMGQLLRIHRHRQNRLQARGRLRMARSLRERWSK